MLVVRITGDPDRPFRATKLNLTGNLGERLADGARAGLATLRRRELIEHDENWTPDEGQLPIADVPRPDPLLGELEDAYAAETGPDEEPVDDTYLGAYALVAIDRERAAYIVRNRRPVQRLHRRRIQAVLSGNQLSEIERLFVYDAGIDVAVWDGKAAINNLNAYESLFFTPQQRETETRQALAALTDRIPVAEPAMLAELAARDRNFARTLRRAVKAGALEVLDVDRVRDNISRWGLDGVHLRDGRVVVELAGTGRWQFLRLLGDSYLISAATGRRYEVNSKRAWPRRWVQRVAVTNGVVTAVASDEDWGQASAEQVLDGIALKRHIYYMFGETIGVTLLGPLEIGDTNLLWAGPDDASNALLELPRFEPG